MNSKQLLFDDLVSKVNDCSRCSRMSQRRRVLGSSNGSLNSEVVFIGEAPGRLGADKFGIPLYGDQTGRNFEWLISNAGIARKDIFITNAVLCNPRTADGNNDSPTSTEIHNCAPFLKETLEIIGPRYVAPLGKAALAALNTINPLAVKLRENVGQLLAWTGYQVYPLYHPGPRSFVWRTRAQQELDYRTIACLLKGDPLGSEKTSGYHA